MVSSVLHQSVVMKLRNGKTTLTIKGLSKEDVHFCEENGLDPDGLLKIRQLEADFFDHKHTTERAGLWPYLNPRLTLEEKEKNHDVLKQEYIQFSNELWDLAAQFDMFQVALGIQERYLNFRDGESKDNDDKTVELLAYSSE